MSGLYTQKHGMFKKYSSDQTKLLHSSSCTSTHHFWQNSAPYITQHPNFSQYKIQIVHQLNSQDPITRQQFFPAIFGHSEWWPEIHECFVFEVHFHMLGYINKQNVRIKIHTNSITWHCIVKKIKFVVKHIGIVGPYINSIWFQQCGTVTQTAKTSMNMLDIFYHDIVTFFFRPVWKVRYL
jgi:hypothetical protein